AAAGAEIVGHQVGCRRLEGKDGAIKETRWLLQPTARPLEQQEDEGGQRGLDEALPQAPSHWGAGGFPSSCGACLWSEAPVHGHPLPCTSCRACLFLPAGRRAIPTGRREVHQGRGVGSEGWAWARAGRQREQERRRAGMMPALTRRAPPSEEKRRSGDPQPWAALIRLRARRRAISARW